MPYPDNELAEVRQSIGDDLLRWGGFVDDDGRPTATVDEMDRFAEVLQHSSIPEACGLIREGMALERDACPVCGAQGADQSCTENGRLIDDHGERGA